MTERITLYIPDGVQRVEPLVLQDCDIVDTITVTLGDGASATVYDRTAGSSFTRSVIYNVGVGARLTVIHDVQNATGTARYVLRCAQDSIVHYGFVSAHTTSSTMSFDVELLGERAQALVRGVYIGNDTAIVTLTTNQRHEAAHTMSDVRINGCLAGQARALYHGKIYVAGNAVGTQAEQRNDTLLLSTCASARSIPSLEVLTNQVQCAHGSAVGRVDEEQIRYMQTRGIARERARHLLIEGFVNTTLDGHGELQEVARRVLQCLKK